MNVVKHYNKQRDGTPDTVIITLTIEEAKALEKIALNHVDTTDEEALISTLLWTELGEVLK